MPYKNPEDRRRYERARRAEIRRLIEKTKSQPCLDCGIQYPPYVMQLDHVRGDKKFQLSAAVRITFDLGKIQEEINKCEVVCANCHAERTHQRMEVIRLDKELVLKTSSR